MSFLRCWLKGHVYGIWRGNRETYPDFYAYRERVCCNCSRTEKQETTSVLEFDRWIDEAKSEKSSD